jgi:DNA-3-methyladenine glycosylase
MQKRLPKEFFLQPTLIVAEQLLGKILNFGSFQGIITETEAYIGENDPACHASRGRTKRTEVMFKEGGYSYVYFIYGMYYCLNVVTEAENFPAAVLIRGIKLLTPEEKKLDGPGKLCKYLGITTAHNNINMLSSDELFITDNISNHKFITTPRIGIKVGVDKLWRFLMSA